VLFFFGIQSAIAQSERPKTGFTLSCGGARGIGQFLLRAVDSVGIRIDYVTGTSIGAMLKNR